MKLFTAIVVLGLAAIVWMNSCVDAAGLDTFDRVWELSSRQGPDDLVVWDSLFDQRAWLKAKLVASCPEVLILGSSTVGALSQDMFENHHILNGWLSAPTVEDLETITSVLERASCHPKTIVLGVDPWLLNAAFGDQRWSSLLDDYLAYQPGKDQFRARALAVVRRWNVFKERLNYTTTRTSVEQLWRRWRGDQSATRPELVHMPPDAFCATIVTPHYIRANDGHYVSCAAFVSAPAVVDEVARNYVAANTHEIRNWKAIDPARMRRLIAVVRRWHAESRVVLLAPPYHPLAFAALGDNPRVRANLDALDRSLTALAAEGTVSYFNVRDATRVGCAGTEFEDGHHGRPACARKVAQQILRYVN